MIRVLFVDDDPAVLAGLERSLRPQRERWEMDFVDRADRAMARIRQHRYHVVVSDMNMPGTDGPALLRAVRDESPTTVRIILSGYSAQRSAVRSLAVAHTFLAKPCDPALLEAAIDRASLVEAMLANCPLRAELGGAGCLPSPPSSMLSLQSVIARDGDQVEIADVIASDPAMCSKVLQVVNSAFFGLPRAVSDPREAVAFLGIDTIRDLVMSTEVFGAAGRGTDAAAACIETLQRRATVRADRAFELARLAGLDTRSAREVGMGAFLADVGALLVVSVDPSRAAAVIADDGTTDDPILHCVPAAGAGLLRLWGLPNDIVETVALAREPWAAPGSSGAVFTYLANRLTPEEGRPDALTTDMLHIVGLTYAAVRELVTA